MALSLSQLRAYRTKRRKRIGRGDSSGHGTYSTRGLKGQRARTGGRNKLRMRGLKQFLLQIPKRKGMKPVSAPFMVIDIADLDAKFEANTLVTLEKLIEVGLVKKNTQRVKVLGKGPCHKKLTVRLQGFSNAAKNAITKAGGIARIAR